MLCTSFSVFLQTVVMYIFKIFSGWNAEQAGRPVCFPLMQRLKQNIYIYIYIYYYTYCTCMYYIYINLKYLQANFWFLFPQVICNADLVFINVIAKWPGSVHDAQILCDFFWLRPLNVTGNHFTAWYWETSATCCGTGSWPLCYTPRLAVSKDTISRTAQPQQQWSEP